ncbi:alpha/beta fold hydrolase [Halogranum rubrum]|uniref:Arylesterase n=1 Tax=Halogranum salarium B-1 TaxID=1210908 RepID=J3JF63_9EURY|nr:alpha/beta hydrolase [Halogranum salarium]EJN58979.1 Arylesterase [Halogranum salarium B-1]
MTHVQVEDGTEIFVRDMGEGDPIVFLHGWPLSHRMFEYQYHYLLDEGFRCIGIDHRGYGESDKPYGDYSYDRFADDLKAVLDELDVDGVTLAGFSMGGGIATHYMNRHDEAHVDKLALLAAASPCLTKKSDFPEGLDEEELNPLIEGARTDRAAMNAEFGQMLFHTEQSDEMMEWLWSLGMDASGLATAASAETFRDADLRPDMDGITVPTKIYHGVHDEITPFEITAEVLEDGIENAELVRFENSGHGLVADETEKLNEELAEFAG